MRWKSEEIKIINIIRNFFKKRDKKNIIEGLPNVPNSMFSTMGKYEERPKY